MQRPIANCRFLSQIDYPQLTVGVNVTHRPLRRADSAYKRPGDDTDKRDQRK